MIKKARHTREGGYPLLRSNRAYKKITIACGAMDPRLRGDDDGVKLASQ